MMMIILVYVYLCMVSEENNYRFYFTAYTIAPVLSLLRLLDGGVLFDSRREKGSVRI